MRADVVDKYISEVMTLGAQSLAKGPNDPKNWVRIIEQIYRLNMDNRILNNLRN